MPTTYTLTKNNSTERLTMATKTLVLEQLNKTLKQLEDELKRSEPSDEKLEFLYRKIMILEAFL